MAWLQKVAVW